MMLRNVGDYLSADMAQHPGRLQSAPSNIKKDNPADQFSEQGLMRFLTSYNSFTTSKIQCLLHIDERYRDPMIMTRQAMYVST